MTKKTICIFSAFFPPHIGGVERYVYELSLQLVELGYHVNVITSNTENFINRENYKGINVYRLPVFHLINGRFPTHKPNREFFSLWKEIKSIPADYYIINMRFYPASLLGMCLSKINRKPLIMIEHVTGHFTINNKFLDSLGHIYEHFSGWLAKRNITAAYGISEACNKWLEHFGIKSSGILYNGIDTSYKIVEPSDIREKYKLPYDSNIFTYGGRLIKEKGILTLLTAFEKIGGKYPNAFLFIAGNGILQQELENKYRERLNNVIILGNIEYDEMMNIVSQSDAIVYPSYYPEGLPTLILEAALHKCAVITTSVGGVRELIDNEDFGIIIRPDSENDIVEAIEKILINIDYKEKIENNLHERVVMNFSWHATAKKLVEELENLLLK